MPDDTAAVADDTAAVADDTRVVDVDLLIAVGFGEAATAVNNAAHYVDPEAPVFPGPSTDTPGASTTAVAA